jgi:hypothetical protein
LPIEKQTRKSKQNGLTQTKNVPTENETDQLKGKRSASGRNGASPEGNAASKNQDSNPKAKRPFHAKHSDTGSIALQKSPATPNAPMVYPCVSVFLLL